MLINYNFNNIAINFYGPLFLFFMVKGQPEPRAYNVLSLSRGYKHFCDNKEGGLSQQNIFLRTLKEGIFWQKQVVDLL